MYLGDLYGSNNIPKYAAPARETDYSNLPPTYTYVGTIEPFFDETKNYVEELKKANVPIHLNIYEGCFHGFDILGSKTNIGKEARNALIENFQYATNNYFKKQTDVKL